MTRLIISKRRSLHKKRKKVRPNIGKANTVDRRSPKSGVWIDVADRAKIVVVQGDSDAQQSALRSLRGELSKINKSFDLVTEISIEAKGKQSKAITAKWSKSG